MNETKKYFVGLDCGTSSVGWAVSDDHYQLLTAKDKTMWGSRLFDEAQAADTRRLSRSNRRRLRRTRDRVKLLQLLFESEMIKMDPDFYLRLKESFLQREDRDDKIKASRHTLFVDPDFTDKDYYDQYPTIWHLRLALLTAPAEQHFDLRLYYLAITHIMTHRGHFLREGKFTGAGEFLPLYQEFIEVAANYDFTIDADVATQVQQLLLNKNIGLLDRKKQLEQLLFVTSDDESLEDMNKRQKELAALLAGSKVTPQKIFSTSVDNEAMKFQLTDDWEEKLPELEAEISSEQLELIMSVKKLADWATLKQLLGQSQLVSEAMVDNYQLHQKQLHELKTLLKPYPDDYRHFFKTIKGDKLVNYNAYTGKAYSTKENGRKTHYQCSQEDINKEIKRLLEKHGLQSPLLSLAEKNELLPKQRGQAKGTIPQQLHHNELELILERLCRDYPSFAEVTAGEDESYNTKAKKIATIHSFRIPYYCGPLVNKNKSQFSWASEEINELVRPWNFAKLVNLDERANAFIKRMTSKCTYLPTEDVLPKASLLYQKYCVLNELNNLKFNGYRLEHDVKQKQTIYNELFADINDSIKGNITLKSLTKQLHERGLIPKNTSVTGTSETKFLPRLSTHHDFSSILGDDYQQKFTNEQLEKVIDLITILGNEKKILAKKIRETLGEGKCDQKQAQKLAHKNYTDWSRFSATFLTKIKATINGQQMNLIQALWETNYNLMELLGQQFDFSQIIDEFNHTTEQTTTITYQDIKKLYCSAPVRRSIWQTLRLVDEIVRVQGNAPAKIFIEATRGSGNQPTPKYTASRQKKLIDGYHKLAQSSSSQELLAKLESTEPRDLQSKKLYLYYAQVGRCAYCGEHIHLEQLSTRAYDIDHIYPQSLTKDDSLANNNVLVCATHNRKKTDRYPLNTVDPSWQSNMHGHWESWRKAGLITKEKYDRLTRTTPLTTEELSGFIARQLVETSQTVRALRDLLTRRYPQTKIVLVKGGQVSDFRHHFTQGYHNEQHQELDIPAHPEFVKVRALNDLHHAMDAYLNIVVGNVMSQTFTDNPYTWLKEHQNQHYSLKPYVIFRERPSEKYPEFPRGWYYQESIQTISQTLQKPETILWTRQTDRVTGQISDLQIVGKNKNPDTLPIKRGLDPKKYGGYNSLKGSYFALIKLEEKQVWRRKIVQIPIMETTHADDYLARQYPGCQILLPRIEKWSLLIVDGNPMRIAGRTGKLLVFAPAVQTILDKNANSYLKRVISIQQKVVSNNKYRINETKDRVNKELNLALYDKLIAEYKKLSTMPFLGATIAKFDDNARNIFIDMNLIQQCQIVTNLLMSFSSGTTTANLSLLLPAATQVGTCRMSNDITDHHEVRLIQESPTGLFVKVMDLLSLEAKS